MPRAGPAEAAAVPAAESAGKASPQDVADDDAADDGTHVGSAAAVSRGVGPLRGPDIVVGQRLRLRCQHRRTVGVRDGFGHVAFAFGLGRLDLPLRLGEPGTRLGTDTAAARVDEVRHGLYPRLGGEQGLIERAGQALRRFAFLGHAGQQPVQVGVGLGQPGERAEWVGAAGLLRLGDGRHRGLSGRGQFGGLRRVGLLQLPARLVDAVLDVGDRRRQRGHRPVDVGRRAVDGVEQRARLPE